MKIDPKTIKSYLGLTHKTLTTSPPTGYPKSNPWELFTAKIVYLDDTIKYITTRVRMGHQPELLYLGASLVEAECAVDVSINGYNALFAAGDSPNGR